MHCVLVGRAGVAHCLAQLEQMDEYTSMSAVIQAMIDSEPISPSGRKQVASLQVVQQSFGSMMLEGWLEIVDEVTECPVAENVWLSIKGFAKQIMKAGAS